jgi:hypothetical protein
MSTCWIKASVAFAALVAFTATTTPGSSQTSDAPPLVKKIDNSNWFSSR